MSVVIGVDPDSKKHGIAIYIDGDLESLKMLDLMGCIDLVSEYTDAKWIIEHVDKNQFIYTRNNQKNKALQAKVGMAVGKCQQSQIELVRMLEHFNMKYKLIAPTKDNWSKDKAQFTRFTGWTKRSNEDTRSAAYFGYLGLR